MEPQYTNSTMPRDQDTADGAPPQDISDESFTPGPEDEENAIPDSLAGRHAGLMASLAAYTQKHPESKRPRHPIQPWLADLVRINGNNQSPPPRLYAWTPANVPPEVLELGEDEMVEEGVVAEQVVPEEMVDNGMDPERVYIIGAGNLGRLYAATFSKYPTPPPITLVVHRPQLLRHWALKPYLSFTPPNSTTPQIFSNFNVELWSPHPPSTGPIREVASGQTIRRLLVATRASEALLEVDRVRHYLDHRSTVLFAQNGMCRLWPPNGAHYVGMRYERDPAARPNYGAVITTHGVTSSGPFASVHASWANVVAGPVLPNELAQPPTFDTKFLELFATPELEGSLAPAWDLWTRQLDKLLINAVINPLTAILRCKNGVLFQQRDHGDPVFELMQALTFEAWLVFQRLRTRREFYTLVRAYAGSVPLDRRFGYARLWEHLLAVGEKVKENTSSMLQHVQMGKSTEVRDFNGWIVDMARLVKLRDGDVEYHAKLVELVEEGAVLEEGQLEEVFGLNGKRERMWGTVESKLDTVVKTRVNGLARNSQSLLVPSRRPSGYGGGRRRYSA